MRSIAKWRNLFKNRFLGSPWQGLRLTPKKINVFHIVKIEIATVAYGSFAMTFSAHFLLHTS